MDETTRCVASTAAADVAAGNIIIIIRHL